MPCGGQGIYPLPVHFCGDGSSGDSPNQTTTKPLTRLSTSSAPFVRGHCTGGKQRHHLSQALTNQDEGRFSTPASSLVEQKIFWPSESACLPKRCGCRIWCRIWSQFNRSYQCCSFSSITLVESRGNAVIRIMVCGRRRQITGAIRPQQHNGELCVSNRTSTYFL